DVARNEYFLLGDDKTTRLSANTQQLDPTNLRIVQGARLFRLSHYVSRYCILLNAAPVRIRSGVELRHAELRLADDLCGCDVELAPREFREIAMIVNLPSIGVRRAGKTESVRQSVVPDHRLRLIEVVEFPAAEKGVFQ